MSNRRNLLKTPHVVHVCVYHVAWATKYRRKVLDLWTRSYFVATAGDVSAATIQACVENQRVRTTDPPGEGRA